MESIFIGKPYTATFSNGVLICIWAKDEEDAKRQAEEYRSKYFSNLDDKRVKVKFCRLDVKIEIAGI